MALFVNAFSGYTGSRICKSAVARGWSVVSLRYERAILSIDNRNPPPMLIIIVDLENHDGIP